MSAIGELRSKSAAELRAELKALQRQSFNLRVQLATQQLKKHSELKKTRRDVARLMTVLGEKQRAAPSK